MAIAFRSSAALASGTRTNSTITAPAGAVNGSDVILAVIGIGNAASTTTSAPSGWTQIATVQYSAADPYFVNMYLFWRVHDGSASYTFTHSSATTDGAVFAYSGVDTSTASDATAATNTGTGFGSTAAQFLSISIATAGALEIGARGSWDGSAITPPAGWTERLDQAANWLGEIAAAGTGATGATNLDPGNLGPNPWGTIHAALRPDSGAVAASPDIPQQHWLTQILGGPWPLTQVAVSADFVAAEDLDSPLLGSYGDSSVYWQVYNSFSNVRPRAYQEISQRRRAADPTLLGTPQLENEFLGGSTTVQRTNLPASHVDRREVPQQRQLESVPGLLDTAELENELLGGATTAQRDVWRRDPIPPQQRPLESVYGLLDDAQLEVLPPLPWWYDTAAYQRLPWLRIKQQRYDQSAAAVITDLDPTLNGGYGSRWLWRRDPYAPTQRLSIQNPDGDMIVGTGATMAWWGVDDSAIHYWHMLPTASDPSLYIPTVATDPTLAGYGPRWLWYRPAAIPQQKQLESPYDLLNTALLEISPPLSIAYGLAATHQRLPWLRIKQQQYDQSAAAIITDLDPTLSGGYGPEWRWWYRPPVAPVQRERESDPGLLLTALFENELLGGADDLARHRAWSARPWFGLQRTAVIDQSVVSTFFDPTQAGYGPRWMWYRPPVAPVQRERESDPALLNTALLEDALLGGWDDLARHRAWSARSWFGLQMSRLADQSIQPLPDADPTQAGYGPRWMWYRLPVAPVQRDRKSDPRLLTTALLEDVLLGGWDDILRHRAWYVDRREVPQQRSYPDALQPLADPLLVGGAEWRYKLIPVTHKARWVLRQWWEQQMFRGSPLVLFEGTVTGGVLSSGSTTGAGSLGGSLVGFSRDGYMTGEVR